MKLYMTVPAIIAAGFLSACDSPNQFEDTIGLMTALDSDDVQDVAVDDLPDNASMKGYLTASESDSVGGTVYIGDADVDFNFANGTLNGTASNFNEYQLAEGCLDDLASCTGEQTRDINGSLGIIGGIDGTYFYYDANGQLTAVDDELGPLTANVYLNGEGAIGSLNDNLVAVGSGGGGFDLYDANGYLVGYYLDNFLILEE